MFDETLKLIASLPGRRPAAPPHRLDALFERLARASDAVVASRIEDAIWSRWMSHADPQAEEKLERAAQAIGAGDHAEAEALLDELVAGHPDYAEAWNKRATLYFRLGRDAESVCDIHRTLALEPRHFGAICGFGQIALRRGHRAAALFAFDAALRINPHLGAVRAAREKLAAESPGTAH
jgi:tetratricopeptide (TPR) repeat protein